MQKSALCFLMILVGMAILAGCLYLTVTGCRAEEPNIEISLRFVKYFNEEKGEYVPIYFDKGEPVIYRYGDPIGAVIFVHNKSNILISEGTRSRNFILDIQIVNPKGRILYSNLDGFHDEFPDAPPLPFKRVGEKYIQVAPCEKLGEDDKARQYPQKDLREFYGIGIPGKYTAQVRVFVTTFKEEPCDLDNPKWVGIITSEEVEFSIRPPKKSTGPKPILIASVLKTAFKSLIKIIDTPPVFAANKPKCPRIENENPMPNAQSVSRFQGISFEVHETSYNSDNRPGDIKMSVNGAEITQNELNVTALNKDSYKVEYNLYPSYGYLYCQLVNVVITAINKRGKQSCSTIHRFSFRIERPLTLDADGDCILDKDELNLGTDPEKKTLFIRPMIKNTTTGQYGPWLEIISPSQQEQWQNEIAPGLPQREFDRSAFQNADIELVILGNFDPTLPSNSLFSKSPFANQDYDPSNPAHHKDKWGNIHDFDPVRNGWQGPPCDIVIINAKPCEVAQYCRWRNINDGHIYFLGNPQAGLRCDQIWSWDTRGYVPFSPDSNFTKYGYFTPEIYTFAIYRYFRDCLYTAIAQNQSGTRPQTGTPPVRNTCVDGWWDYSNSTGSCQSPMNIGCDGNAEFNEIEFSSSSEIISVPVPATIYYDYYKVRDRILSHEIGHAVIGNSGNYEGHCTNKSCIMCNETVDYEYKTFELGCDCLRKIKEGIHNSVHLP